ncbi:MULTISPECIES: DUF7453 family protein [Cyanophyceae]|uniref:DUF7453 family protein n=1 Tax=Cyanophyceae TaxID=3028117 RepID=UPI00168292A4|nr:choice-of-anchor tandem repeat NxxGxxAF-containing protein [Trichocoleus sp. FACHB-40]MBD2006029.1 PEP-CTERM sorting domain-containing protein [Trichocoleus sp. FACHB-40]
MKLHLSLPAALMGLCLGLLGTGEAQAASFTFTKIADTSGFFDSFRGEGMGDYEPIFATPAINNQGTVAFSAFLDAGGKGIFTGNGTTTTSIANTNNLFGSPPGSPTVGYTLSELGSFSINDVGNVAFSANFGRTGIFTSELQNEIEGAAGDSFTRIDYPSINNVGTVAFLRTISRFSGLTTILTGKESVEGVIASTRFYTEPPAAGVFEKISAPMINDQGTVVFSADVYQSDSFYDDLSSGIFTGNGTRDNGEIITNTIADSNGAFNSFSDPSINNSGTVAFSAALDTGSRGVFTGNGTTTTTIADSSGAFNSFGTPSINDFGTVAFLAGLDTGGSGIFTGNNPFKDKVIVTGDTLFGSTVQGLSFYREGLNNSGQVAFFASLANGTSGIFRADPIVVEPPKDVPEPAGLLGLLAFGTFGATSVMKRKQK